jgi:hypothetical protein
MYDAVKIPPVAPRSRAAIEGIAGRFLALAAPQCLQIPRPTPTVKIFDQLLPRFGFVAHVGDLAPGLEGITDCVEREVILAPHVYQGMERGNGRCRFAAAHEFGHVLMHAPELAARVGLKFVNGDSVRLARRSDIKPYRNPEWQADVFAAELLMPGRMVRLAVEHLPMHERLATVVKIFATSEQAARYRLQRLGLLPGLGH